MDNKIYKAKEQFILRNIAGESVLVSVGDAVADFCGIVSLNPSAVVLWKALQLGASRTDLVQALLDEYEIEEELARTDVDKTLKLLLSRGLITELVG